mgnify:CR=1 FL=1
MATKTLTDIEKSILRVGNAISDLEDFDEDWPEEQRIGFSIEWVDYLTSYDELKKVYSNGLLTPEERLEYTRLKTRMELVLPTIQKLNLEEPT